MTLTQQEAIAEIIRERHRQDEKWDVVDLHGSPKLLAILVEEVGEVAKAICEKDTSSLRDELIQVAAVRVKWLERGL